MTKQDRLLSAHLCLEKMKELRGYPSVFYEDDINTALECIEKCMRIKELRANELVSEELIDAYVIDKDGWNKYIKNNLCTRLIKSLDESDAIIVTEERDAERHQRIYRVGLEVVLYEEENNCH